MKYKYLSILLFILNLSSVCFSQSTSETIKSIDKKLTRVETTITKVLTDSSLMYLHSLTAFREVIKKHALPEKIKLNTENESGTPITIKGIVLNQEGHFQTNKLVYVYQTSSKGWYSDTGVHVLQNEGDRKHARLFGYFKTDGLGKFEFKTIKPAGYPRSGLPAHIHIEIMGERDMLITELQFDDDPRLTEEVRNRSIKEHFIIEKNIGTMAEPIYSYTIFIN